LAIETIGGLSVGANPSSAYNNPAAVLPASQPNPVPVVVRCSNVPLGTQIFLNARSPVGQTTAASGYNNSDTPASSAANIAINLPRFARLEASDASPVGVGGQLCVVGRALPTEDCKHRATESTL